MVLGLASQKNVHELIRPPATLTSNVASNESHKGGWVFWWQDAPSLCLAPCNKCCALLHHNPVSVDWLCCVLGDWTQVWFSNSFGNHKGTVIQSGHLACGTSAPGWCQLSDPVQQLPEHLCLKDSLLLPTRRHCPWCFCGEGNKALVLVCKSSLVIDRTSVWWHQGILSYWVALIGNFLLWGGGRHRTW